MTTRRASRPAQPAPDLGAMIEHDRRQRLAACQAEIQAALDRHRCRLMAAPLITADGRLSARLVLEVDLGSGGAGGVLQD